MILSACATKERYIINNIVPRAQFGENELPGYPQCNNEITGDLLACERELRDWGCLTAHQFDRFMRRASGDKDSVSIPIECASNQL